MDDKVRARRYIAALLGALLPLSVGGATSIDWALCVADDGHATIEIAHEDAECWTDARRHHAGQTALALSELDHHSCKDIPIVQAQAGHPAPQRPLLAQTLAVRGRTETFRAAPARAAVGAERGFPIDTTLHSRRSVVLIV